MIEIDENGQNGPPIEKPEKGTIRQPHAGSTFFTWSSLGPFVPGLGVLGVNWGGCFWPPDLAKLAKRVWEIPRI